MRPRRRPLPRTEAVQAHEELGLALGRMTLASPDFQSALTAGFTRALREHANGRTPNLAADTEGYEAAVERFRRVHAPAPMKASKRRKSR